MGEKKGNKKSLIIIIVSCIVVIVVGVFIGKVIYDNSRSDTYSKENVEKFLNDNLYYTGFNQISSEHDMAMLVWLQLFENAKLNNPNNCKKNVPQQKSYVAYNSFVDQFQKMFGYDISFSTIKELFTLTTDYNNVCVDDVSYTASICNENNLNNCYILSLPDDYLGKYTYTVDNISENNGIYIATGKANDGTFELKYMIKNNNIIIKSLYRER